MRDLQEEDAARDQRPDLQAGDESRLSPMRNLEARMSVCPCCDRSVDDLRKSPWVSVPVCIDCLDVWYDGATTDARIIRRRVREKYNLSP